jgi:predicted DNA-binding WGR domain protein
MMDAFSTWLEARDPVQGRFRSYQVEAGTDLFGAWLVEVTYGRIGTRGRRIQYAARDEAAARKCVRRVLRRRATAPKRIGVSYRFRELIDPGHWFPIAVEQSLTSALRGRQGDKSPEEVKR